eukprot:TRINITY_DN5558_c0_g1_i1.p1 TRINITY_DN5558_c0_g1~~TRINITY_DN5558_c0_g1_i1.p1  ORF type:complete len:167 (-),score=6.84 TRINITY_DN5558_c0_g1_i1:116-616(-)
MLLRWFLFCCLASTVYSVKPETIYMSFGCFWVGEFWMDCVPGVYNHTTQTEVGFMGCGPALESCEVVKVVYNPQHTNVSLLMTAHSLHDPSPYIWTTTAAQLQDIRQWVKRNPAASIQAMQYLPKSFRLAPQSDQHFYANKGYKCGERPPQVCQRHIANKNNNILN